MNDNAGGGRGLSQDGPRRVGSVTHSPELRLFEPRTHSRRPGGAHPAPPARLRVRSSWI